MATPARPEVQVIFDPSTMDPINELIVNAMGLEEYETMFRFAKADGEMDFVPRIRGIYKEVVYDPVHMRFSDAQFLELHNTEEALGLCELKTHTNHVDKIKVGFVIPSKDKTTRLKWKMVGGCLLKLKEVNRDIKATGAVTRYNSALPVLPSNFKDKDDVERELKRFKKSRDTGKLPTSDELEYLSSYKPIELEKLQEKLDALLRLKADVLYNLRTLQWEGLEFDFESE